MKWLNVYRIRLVLLGFVAAIVLCGGLAKADFTFGTPTNLGPIVNSSSRDREPSISADSLSLYFSSDRAGGYGNLDLWIITRATTSDPWEEPMNMGPTINTPYNDAHPSISLDGLTLFFASNRPGGYGERDLWVTTRSATSEPWSEPVNLGPTVNSSSDEAGPSISADGLELFFQSRRSGSYGGGDTWVTIRTTTSDPWAEPVNLGQGLNSPSSDGVPDISADGLMLFYRSQKSGTYGSGDIWFSKRATVKDDWGMPVHPGPPVNTTASDSSPNISADGSILYFHSTRSGGLGGYDLWQVPIIPIVDFNGDRLVDAADMCLMVDHWGTDEPLCDIGPMPWGDGIIDVHDLIVLAEHLFEDLRIVAHWKFDETGGSIAYDSIDVNDGICYGEPIWQPAGGMIDGALQLDGINDYVSTPFVLNPADGSLSAFAWIKGGAPGQTIISQIDATRGTGSAWLCIDPSDGRLITRLMHPPFSSLESESVITNGLWHHVGVVYNFDGLHRCLYLDGVEVAKDISPVAAIGSDGGLYIGADKTLEATTFFSGLIDDVRIYDAALSAEEVAALAR